MRGNKPRRYYEPNPTPDYRKYILIAVVVLLTVVVGAAMSSVLVIDDTEQNSELNHSELYAEYNDSVVGISIVTEEGLETGGTGFVYEEGGEEYIVTNAHVVESADRIDVQYSNNEWASGEVIGEDANSDLAVVEVDHIPEEVGSLEVVEENPERGENVLVIGSPLDLDQSVSHGIVTGVDRSLPLDDGFSIPDVIQMDASVNPGNSGSPVLNAEGDVVGVVSAKQGESIGFAISPEIAHVVVPELIEYGEFTHTHVGIRTIQNTPVIAEGNSFDEQNGVAVVDVVEGSPADGVFEGVTDEEMFDSDEDAPQVGDLIIGVGDVTVDSHEDMSSYLMKNASPGDTVEFTVVRDGDVKVLEVVVGERPDSSEEPSDDSSEP